MPIAPLAILALNVVVKQNRRAPFSKSAKICAICGSILFRPKSQSGFPPSYSPIKLMGIRALRANRIGPIPELRADTTPPTKGPRREFATRGGGLLVLRASTVAPASDTMSA